jgi:hypothetical protein
VGLCFSTNSQDTANKAWKQNVEEQSDDYEPA